MKLLNVLVGGCFALAVKAAVLPRNTTEVKSAQIKQLLTSQLSKNASIIFPTSKRWDEVTHRAAAPRVNPGYLAVVDVAVEDDVVRTIRIANEIGVPFLAVTGTHGWTDDISRIQDGIQIRMRGLNHVTLGPRNDTAYAGGGVIQYEVLQALYHDGKQAVHGLCECVSIMGPLLGGGHSVLQGAHGFAADNLVSAKVALHNGTVVMASENENEDLFWGLRGAGHNLGIVLEFAVKVYDIHPDPWTFMTFVYEADKIEEYFEAWNQLEDLITDPGLIVLNGYYRMLPDLDTEKPLLVLELIYQGYDTAAPQYIDAYRAIKPIREEIVSEIRWNELFDITNFGRNDRVCVPSQNWAGYVNSVTRWDPASMRESYNIFADLVAIEAYNTSTFIFESYGRKGVRAFPDDFNAVAPEERNKHNMLAAFIFWTGDNGTELATAREFGERLQITSRNGEIAHSYVNYAIGGEELAQVYGRDSARLQKLRGIKAKFDPYNEFGFYAPLADA
jgi:FAD/FMN-containing dehydrogenase